MRYAAFFIGAGFYTKADPYNAYHIRLLPTGAALDIQQIIADLEAERNRLDTAIAALRGGRRHKEKTRNGRRRRMSAESKRKISEAQKKAWAARKRGSKTA